MIWAMFGQFSLPTTFWHGVQFYIHIKVVLGRCQLMQVINTT